MGKVRMLALLLAVQGLVACGGPETADGAAAASEAQAEADVVGARCGTIAGLTCGTGEYCDLGAGHCAIADAAGVCKRRPVACPLLIRPMPVCGCNGRTYPSACNAAMAGVSIDHQGACVAEPKRCGGFAGLPCDKGQYCQFPTGQCDAADIFGTCQPIPQICNYLYQPVCGCDGRTYGNACEAAASSMSLDHTGACVQVQ